MAALRQAVECYRGDLLPGCYDDWLQIERERLYQALLAALEKLILLLERGQHFGFSLESREAIGVARNGGGQHLDRHRSLQVAVGRAVHLPHTALAKLGKDLVGTDACARDKRHAAESTPKSNAS